MVAGAVVIGVVVGVAVLDAIQGQSEPPPAKVPDLPLAARLQTATSDLQKTSQPVVLPQLTLSDSIGDANVPLKLGVEVKNYTADATVDLSGLPAGTVLSTGSAREVTGSGASLSTICRKLVSLLRVTTSVS